MYYKPRVEESMEVGFRKVAILPELTLAYLSMLTSEIIMLEGRLQVVHFSPVFKRTDDQDNFTQHSLTNNMPLPFSPRI